MTPKPKKCFSCHEHNTEHNLIILKKVKINGEEREICQECYMGYLDEAEAKQEKTNLPKL